MQKNHVYVALFCAIAALLLFGQEFMGSLMEVVGVVAYFSGAYLSWKVHPALGVAAILIFPLAVVIGFASLLLQRNAAVDAATWARNLRNSR